VRQCADPFHVIKLANEANEAIEATRRVAWKQARQQTVAKRGRGRPRNDAPPPPRNQGRWVKHTRWALVKDPAALKPSQLDVLHKLRRSGSVLYRCWQLKEGLRDLYRLAGRRPSPPRVVAALGVPLPHPRVPHPRQHRPSQPRQDLGSHRAWLVELQARRDQQQDQADQPPRLRTPQRSRPHRHHLPVLRRDHRPATHGKVRSPPL